MGKWDAIIVGAGHNGLITSLYLARAGWKVWVLERRNLVGGWVTTEELIPGFKFSRGAQVVSRLRPQIIKELQLDTSRFQFIHRDPAQFVPTQEKGKYLLLGTNDTRNYASLSQFSKQDAENLSKYEATMDGMINIIEPFLDMTPIDKLGVKLGIKQGMELGKGILKARDHIPEYVKILTAPASTILDRWFESDNLKGMLAMNSVFGAFLSPKTPASGYVLLMHQLGAALGIQGTWAYCEGGMGSLSEYLADRAMRAGVKIQCDAHVDEIMLDGSKVTGVRLENGDVLEAGAVASNWTPEVTFNHLLRNTKIPRDIKSELSVIDYSSATVKINLALKSLPKFTCIIENENQLFASIYIGCEGIESMHTSYLEATRGVWSSNPNIYMMIPSVMDPTLAPEGQHVCSLFVQYAPYHLDAGWNEETKEKYSKIVIDKIEEYAPGFRESIIWKEVLSPVDFESLWGLTGGNIFHGSMGISSMYFNRPTSSMSGYQTYIDGLYLCGAGTHPGGGVMGAPGRNCSKVMVKN